MYEDSYQKIDRVKNEIEEALIRHKKLLSTYERLVYLSNTSMSNLENGLFVNAMNKIKKSEDRIIILNNMLEGLVK